jgi:hypothetical protein
MKHSGPESGFKREGTPFPSPPAVRRRCAPVAMTASIRLAAFQYCVSVPLQPSTSFRARSKHAAGCRARFLFVRSWRPVGRCAVHHEPRKVPAGVVIALPRNVAWFATAISSAPNGRVAGRWDATSNRGALRAAPPGCGSCRSNRTWARSPGRDRASIG